MEFTGDYYIWDYSDSHCPECGSQEGTELNAKEVKQIANRLLLVRDNTKNRIGRKLRLMLKFHDD